MVATGGATGGASRTAIDDERGSWRSSARRRMARRRCQRTRSRWPHSTPRRWQRRSRCHQAGDQIPRQIDAFPTIFVLDAKGVIRYKFYGFVDKELDAAVEKLLSEHETQKGKEKE